MLGYMSPAWPEMIILATFAAGALGFYLHRHFRGKR